MMMDHLEQLSIKLEKCHLAYLQTDESPSKLKQRHKLEGFIKEYLYLVPHENKYVFPETAHILHRSAATVSEFSGYRACSAWTAISLYAANLLAQPWRKEYRTLRAYSGYYKHEIEANLVGAELMFELMGYKHTGLGVLFLDGPIDPDKVSFVSRDAIVAFVECQIMKEIWEKLSQTFTISWIQVLEFRENHVGTPEQAVRALTHRYWERMFQNRPNFENYRDLHFAQPAIIDTMQPTYSHHAINNYKPNIHLPESDYRYQTEHLRYYQTLQTPLLNGLHNMYGCIPAVNNRIYDDGIHRDYFVHNTPNYGTKIPGGHLIELEPPTPVINYEKSRNKRCSNKSIDQVDFSSRCDENNYYSKIERKPIKTSVSLDSASSNESWNFVYRSLDNLGHSKDIGDREDVLRKKSHSKTKSSKVISEEQDQKWETNVLSQKKNQSNGNDLYNNKSSLQLIDLNLSNDDEECRHYKYSSQALARNIKNNDNIVDLVNNVSIRSKDENESKSVSGGKWNCSTCTYLNSSDREICEMCNKSRWKGNEDKPLASGGKECPKCTLVNEKNAAVCEVCNTSLKDSPTYI